MMIQEGRRRDLSTYFAAGRTYRGAVRSWLAAAASKESFFVLRNLRARGWGL